MYYIRYVQEEETVKLYNIVSCNINSPFLIIYYVNTWFNIFHILYNTHIN